MEKFNELTEKGITRRLKKVYGLLDTETSDKILEEYNYLYDDELNMQDKIKLANMILAENRDSGNMNCRKYNSDIAKLLS